MALAVPLSRFTPRVGGGSAFYVRRHYAHGYIAPNIRCGQSARNLGDMRCMVVRICQSSQSRSFSHTCVDTDFCTFYVRKQCLHCLHGAHFYQCQPHILYSYFIYSGFDVGVAGDCLSVFSPVDCSELSEDTMIPPNKSPEPTAVGACSSAIAVHATSRRWLSFFR